MTDRHQACKITSASRFTLVTNAEVNQGSSQPGPTQVHLELLHPFNGLFSRTTWVNQHQKGKPFWILQEQEMTGWQWHQLHHMQIICTSLQTDNHASSSPLRPDALPTTQPTVSKHGGQKSDSHQYHKNNQPMQQQLFVCITDGRLSRSTKVILMCEWWPKSAFTMYTTA